MFNPKVSVREAIQWIQRRSGVTTGFTLSELLIALAVLGLIATFTIPKVLQSTGNSAANAVTKEMVGSITQAWQQHSLSNGQPSPSIALNILVNQFNGTKIDTSSVIEASDGSYTCSNTRKCISFPNGSLLHLYSQGGFLLPLTDLNVLWLLFDPDGAVGPLQGIWLCLYYNGRVATLGTVVPNSRDNAGNYYNPDPSLDPSWFKWS